MADQIGEVIDDMEQKFRDAFRECMAENKHRREKYFILVTGDWYGNDTQFKMTFTPMESPPPVPLLNTMLWLIDNKAGSIKEIWVLPKDAPVGPGIELSKPVEGLIKIAPHLPLVYS